MLVWLVDPMSTRRKIVLELVPSHHPGPGVKFQQYKRATRTTKVLHHRLHRDMGILVAYKRLGIPVFSEIPCHGGKRDGKSFEAT